jgi:hypothetical protein
LLGGAPSSTQRHLDQRYRCRHRRDLTAKLALEAEPTAGARAVLMVDLDPVTSIDL